MFDLNHDALPDLINVFDNCPAEVSSRINAGGRTFGGGPFFEDLSCGPYSFSSIAVADVDADGDNDFLYMDRNHNQVGMIASDGAGGLAAPVRSALGEISADFAAGDLTEGDGVTELVVTEPQADAVVVYANDGAGRFQFLAFARGGGEPGEVAVGDVDGNRDLDVVTLNRPQQTVTVLLGDGTGRLTRLSSNPIGGTPLGLAVGDVNGDGRSDVLVTRDDPTVSVFLAARADAGDDVAVPESQQAQIALDAFRSADPDGHALTYTWRDASGTLTSNKRRFTPFSTPRPPGTYQFDLTVDDLHGAGSIDRVTVTIEPVGTGNSPEPVTWIGLVNVTAAGSTATKTSGCDGVRGRGERGGDRQRRLVRVRAGPGRTDVCRFERRRIDQYESGGDRLRVQLLAGRWMGPSRIRRVSR